jgi:UTP--glucose-1-phosphate uridylyltransferase
MNIEKAVIPVAGLGTRFLPATLSIPKVMIPILDQPPLHYCVAEALNSGITEIIFVISENQKDIIKNYFSRHDVVIGALKNKGDIELLNRVEEISNMVEMDFVIQEAPLGLGHAVLMAKKMVGKNSFAVLLPDDLILGNNSTLKKMCAIHADGNEVVLAIKKVAAEFVPNLGIVSTNDQTGEIRDITGVVEKPSLPKAPSDLAIVGRYILPPEIFQAIEHSNQGALGEIQLTDAIGALIPHVGCKGYLFKDKHFDVGIPIGLLKASIHQALKRDDTHNDLASWLDNLSLDQK